ncbi:MAG: response regulator transcription factor [Myxococcota bacterium]
MIRAFIADDHAIVREGMRRLFETSGDISVVGEATDGRAVLLAAEGHDWDVLVLDLSLPRVSGLEVLRRLHREHPALPIVVLSMYPEEAFAPRVLAEGAVAYVSKERPLADVEAAIRAAVSGASAPAAAARARAPGEPAAPAMPHTTLSAREYQVFLLVLEGRTNVEIAAELDLVASTVSNHLAKVKQKLGAHTVAEIVAYGHHIGLL